jgi:hypothetical protein
MVIRSYRDLEYLNHLSIAASRTVHCSSADRMR